MSTIVVVRKNSDIVIGSDTLVKLGQMKKSAEYIKNSSKIIKVRESYIAISGFAGIEQILTNYFAKQKALPKFESTDEIFEIFRELHKALKELYYLNPTEDEDDPYESSQMVCLIANKYGIFGIDPLRYVDEYSKFAAYGSGYQFAMGAMKLAYGLNYTAEEIARIGLEVAAEFDDSTGAPFEIFKIKPE